MTASSLPPNPEYAAPEQDIRDGVEALIVGMRALRPETHRALMTNLAAHVMASGELMRDLLAAQRMSTPPPPPGARSRT